MKKPTICATAVIATTLLASCGGTGEADGTGRTGAHIANSWDATDACALLDKAEVGAALNDPVTKTSLAFVNQAAGPNAATSECTYQLQSGGKAQLMARRSPISDNTKEAMDLARKGTEQTLAAFGRKTVEDVPGLGKSAFFVPGINQLNVFLDGDKFVILTVGTASEAQAKSIAIALVNKIGKEH